MNKHRYNRLALVIICSLILILCGALTSFAQEKQKIPIDFFWGKWAGTITGYAHFHDHAYGRVIRDRTINFSIDIIWIFTDLPELLKDLLEITEEHLLSEITFENTLKYKLKLHQLLEEILKKYPEYKKDAEFGKILEITDEYMQKEFSHKTTLEYCRQLSKILYDLLEKQRIPNGEAIIKPYGSKGIVGILFVGGPGLNEPIIANGKKYFIPPFIIHFAFDFGVKWGDMSDQGIITALLTEAYLEVGYDISKNPDNPTKQSNSIDLENNVIKVLHKVVIPCDDCNKNRRETVYSGTIYKIDRK